MLYRNKPNNINRRARTAKKNAPAKVECGERKSNANIYWPVAIQLILFAAKSFIEDIFK